MELRKHQMSCPISFPPGFDEYLQFQKDEDKLYLQYGPKQDGTYRCSFDLVHGWKRVGGGAVTLSEEEYLRMIAEPLHFFIEYLKEYN